MTERPLSKADNSRTTLLICAVSFAFAIFCMPSFAFADEMDFGVDDVQEDEEEDNGGEDESDGDDGTMDFGAEETSEEEGEDSGTDTYSVAVVAIPSSDLDDKERRALEEQMVEGVELDPDYQAEDGQPVLDGLEEAGLASCVTEPLCLANVGRDAGVDRILLGSVERAEGGLTLNIDLFDTEDKLFAKYAEADNLADFDDVEEAVEPTMKDIFDMRVERAGPNYGDGADGSTVQKTIAYSAAVVSLASLGGGIGFGLKAANEEDALQSETDQNEEFTQSEAYNMQRDAERTATLANVMYGSAAVLGVVSGVLFYVEGGSDVGESDQRADRGLKLKPSIGFGKVGLDAAIKF